MTWDKPTLPLSQSQLLYLQSCYHCTPLRHLLQSQYLNLLISSSENCAPCHRKQSWMCVFLVSIGKPFTLLFPSSTFLFIRCSVDADAKRLYSAFHNVTAMIGAGVLSHPYAISKLGWGLVRRRYHELGHHAFIDKLGLWIVVPQQFVVEVGRSIVYMVTGTKSLKKFHATVCPYCKSIKATYFIMSFGFVHFVLAQFQIQLLEVFNYCLDIIIFGQREAA